MATIDRKDARKLTLDEMQHLSYGDHIYIECTNRNNKHFGELVKVKVNGKAKTWKRQDARVEIPYKYGLYEYGQLTEDNEVFVEKGSDMTEEEYIEKYGLPSGNISKSKKKHFKKYGLPSSKATTAARMR